MSSTLTSYAVNVSIIDDDIFGFTKSFQAGLAFPGEAPPRVSLNPAQADIKILDDDGEQSLRIGKFQSGQPIQLAFHDTLLNLSGLIQIYHDIR